jgi:N-acetylmuramoyl-L-alanine amidase
VTPPATDDGRLPLAPGATGAAVRDVCRRLRGLGWALDAVDDDRYDHDTATAVREFQASRGLQIDGICGPQTWAALVEAGYVLGDRLLYLRAPMLRGDDIAALQRQLSALGFDPWRVDGIFGPRTEAALRDFQRNCGLTTDAVCGRDTLAMLGRLGTRTGGAATVSHLREQESLRRAAALSLEGCRIALGTATSGDPLVEALARRFAHVGALPVTLPHPDASVQAADANAADVDAYLGLDLQRHEGLTIAYFATEGYTSVGGQALARQVAEHLAGIGWVAGELTGMQLPVLRETRMPAVQVTLGPPAEVVARLEHLVTALSSAVECWVRAPAGPSDEG